MKPRPSQFIVCESQLASLMTNYQADGSIKQNGSPGVRRALGIFCVYGSRFSRHIPLSGRPAFPLTLTQRDAASSINRLASFRLSLQPTPMSYSERMESNAVLTTTALVYMSELGMTTRVPLQVLRKVARVSEYLQCLCRRPDEDGASRIIAESRTTASRIHFSSARFCLIWRLICVHRGQRIAALEHVRRRQGVASRHLQSTNDRWKLHEDEAGRRMAGWRRSLRLPLAIGIDFNRAGGAPVAACRHLKVA